MVNIGKASIMTKNKNIIYKFNPPKRKAVAFTAE